MFKNKINFHIASGILFVIYFSIVVAIGFLSWGYYKQVYNNEVEFTRNTEQQRLLYAKRSILESFNDSIAQIKIISENQELINYIENKNDSNRLVVESEFLSISKHLNKYDQIRYINNQGYEEIRVNYNSGKPERVQKKDLQNKSSRYYFQEISNLNQGEIYISEFDLNKENGEVEVPYKPMIRFGLPIFNKEGIRSGMIVVNYLGQELVDFISRVNIKNDSVVLFTNNQGYFLKGFDSEDEWGFMFDEKKNKTLKSTNPYIWSKVYKSDSDVIKEQGDGLYVYTTVLPMLQVEMDNLDDYSDKYFWKLISYTSDKVLHVYSRGILNNLIIIYFLFVGLLSLLFWVIIKFIFYKKSKEKEVVDLNDTLQLINKILRHDLSNSFTAAELTLENNQKAIVDKKVKDELSEVLMSGKNLIAQMKELEGMVSANVESFRRIKLHQLVTDISNKYSAKISVKGRVIISCDNAIETVFHNLITNAIKHGGANKIDFVLKRKKDKIVIEVRDNGRGIPAKYREKIFEEGFTYGNTGNTGLGLYVVKKTIKRYGGIIRVVSNKPKGVIFIIELPV